MSLVLALWVAAALVHPADARVRTDSDWKVIKRQFELEFASENEATLSARSTGFHFPILLASTTSSSRRRSGSNPRGTRVRSWVWPPTETPRFCTTPSKRVSAAMATASNALAQWDTWVPLGDACN